MASVRARSIVVVFAFLVAMLQSNSAARAADKVALVIGNAKYSQLGTLNNTVNDATALSQALAKMGFESQLVTDADGSALRNAIKSFTQRSTGKSVSVVFYAGHGVQVAGENYLLPVDFDVPRSESDIRISGIKVDEPFTPAGFGNAFREWCRKAKLPQHCSAHGLRKAACRRLAEARCTPHQIAAISGHKSLSEVQRYTRAADQDRLAAEAVSTLETKKRTTIGKP